jgi:catechol 2,3-dioxygenase-like lactoylglutathione lyase family enzyme
MDLDRSRAWFAVLLGLPLVEENPYVCVFRCDSVTLRVTLVDDRAPQRSRCSAGTSPTSVSRSLHLAAVGGSSTRYGGIEQDSQGIWATPGGDLVAWFVDPDGNTSSLTQFVARGR